MNQREMKERAGLIRSAYEKRYGGAAGVRFYQAPGRVDLMGSHTDYNDGFILACTVDRNLLVGARARMDARLRMYSLNMDAESQSSLDELKKVEGDFANYAKGVLKELLDLGIPATGMDMVVHGTVPVGGNLSSSAALEAVTCEAALGLIGRTLPAWDKINLCWRAEKFFVGLPCGVLDQFTVFMGSADQAAFLDCRSREWEKIPLRMGDAALVVINSGVGRELVTSEYTKRVQECGEAVKYFAGKRAGIKALRDVTMDDIKKYGAGLPEKILRRARHIVSENDRVLSARDALSRGDLPGLGRIMERGFVSCRDDYESSAPALNAIHDIAARIRGVWGTRIAGAGWGGCTISLVQSEALPELTLRLPEEYKEQTGQTAAVWTVHPGDTPGEVREV